MIALSAACSSAFRRFITAILLGPYYDGLPPKLCICPNCPVNAFAADGFFGIECGEKTVPDAVRWGLEHTLLYSSDYLH